MSLLLVLDFVGIFVFAISGAIAVVTRRLDLCSAFWFSLLSPKQVLRALWRPADPYGPETKWYKVQPSLFAKAG